MKYYTEIYCFISDLSLLSSISSFTIYCFPLLLPSFYTLLDLWSVLQGWSNLLWWHVSTVQVRGSCMQAGLSAYWVIMAMLDMIGQKRWLSLVGMSQELILRYQVNSTVLKMIPILLFSILVILKQHLSVAIYCYCYRRTFHVVPLICWAALFSTWRLQVSVARVTRCCCSNLALICFCCGIASGVENCGILYWYQLPKCFYCGIPTLEWVRWAGLQIG